MSFLSLIQTTFQLLIQQSGEVIDMRNMTYGLLLLAMLAGSAGAATTTNGLSSNALNPNGLSSNALYPNGLSSNALYPNGITQNGITQNGITQNGFNPNSLRGQIENSQLNSLLRNAGSHALVGRR
jgi:hypothetical protein